MQLSRRRLLKGAMAASAGGMVGSQVAMAHTAAAGPVPYASLVTPAHPRPSPAPLVGRAFGGETRLAHVHNLHTGESLRAVYYENGRYVPDAMSELMKVLRDWRNGEEHLMDPRLFDVMHALRGKLDTAEPFQVISGYRSPETNAAMHERSHQVASNSQHTQGRASDVRIEGVELSRLHGAALDLAAGGVGYYPVSNFVHVDVGPVRQWSGT